MLIILLICCIVFLIQILIIISRRKYASDESAALFRKTSLKFAASLILFFVLSLISSGLMVNLNTSIMNREYIPVYLKEFKVIYVTDNSDLYFDDGYGNIYWIPKDKLKKVKVFKDSDLKLTSVEKVTAKTSIPTPAKIIVDFGLFTNNLDTTTEYYELCIPVSKLVPITPISEADLHPIFDEAIIEFLMK